MRNTVFARVWLAHSSTHTSFNVRFKRGPAAKKSKSLSKKKPEAPAKSSGTSSTTDGLLQFEVCAVHELSVSKAMFLLITIFFRNNKSRREQAWHMKIKLTK